MTHKEILQEGAKSYSYENPAIGRDYCGGFYCDYCTPCQNFMTGAEFADKHPSINTVKKILCYALKKTNIMLAEDLENGVEWELLIKKAMEE